MFICEKRIKIRTVSLIHTMVDVDSHCNTIAFIYAVCLLSFQVIEPLCKRKGQKYSMHSEKLCKIINIGAIIFYFDHFSLALN